MEMNSEDETREMGRKIGAACEPGMVFSLSGDLGAGKTRFVKGVAAGLGVTDEHAVTSPTFVLMNLYRGRLPIAHFDLYRLDSVDLPSLGFHDLRDEAVTLIEWGEKAEAPLLGDHMRVDFKVTGENSRRLMFQAFGTRSESLLKGLNLYP